MTAWIESSTYRHLRELRQVSCLDDPQGCHRPRGGRRHAAGKVRMEGKGHVISDGDVVAFRFNVE